MSPVRRADPQIRSSTRERTVCTSSLATLADPDEVLLPSRPVSLPRSERDADSKVRDWSWHNESSQGGFRGIFSIDRWDTLFAFGDLQKKYIDGSHYFKELTGILN